VNTGDDPLAEVAGPAFPFRIDPVTGRVAISRGTTKVREDVRVLLATRTGERPLQRDFGTRLRSFVQEPDNDVLRDIIRDEVALSFLRWEPRVLVTNAETLPTPDGDVRVAIDYRHVLDASAETLVADL
jgi:uncharacterized protein